MPETMHEVSLVRTIFRTLEEEFSPQELDRLMGIDLKIGLLSNVHPILMQNAFAAVTEDHDRYRQVELNITEVPIRIRCQTCGEVSEVKNYVFTCSNGHPSNNIIEGEELLIERVYFHEKASTPSESLST